MNKVAKAFVFYQSHLTHEDQVLLLVRPQSDEHKPGALDLPGRVVTEGESLVDVLIEEIHRDSGLMLNSEDLHEITDKEVVKSQSNLEKHVFIVRVNDSRATLDPALIDTAAWYPAHEAAHLFVHPFYGKVLQYILDHRLNESA